MAIEDLPVIKAKDIHQETSVVDRAEVTFDPFLRKCQPDMFERKLFLVLGRGKHKYVYSTGSSSKETKIRDGIFVVTEMYHYGLVRRDDPARDVGYQFPLSFQHIPLESINDYISLIQATG